MLKTGLAMLVMALAASAAQAAPKGSCDEMVAHLDAYLKVHPNATGELRQSVDAQLMHQPTRESVEKAKMQSRDHLVELLISVDELMLRVRDQGGHHAGVFAGSARHGVDLLG